MPDGRYPWARSHAALPLPFHIGDDCFRFFCSTRDASNRSFAAWVDVRLADEIRFIQEGNQPVLEIGEPGAFDDCGLGLGSLVGEETQRLYYMGWNLSRNGDWRNSIGMAQGEAAKPRFERAFSGPIMDRSPEDPYSLSYPWVLRLSSDDWRMWYGSHISPLARTPSGGHAIKYASSSDGVNWQRRADPVLHPEIVGEQALARPSVLVEGTYRMWFAARGDNYTIGYAESRDGLTWTRNDAAYGLPPSAAGWDSEMTCYPCAFRHRGRLYLAYNGNQYGRSGFGLAVWE